MPIMEIPYHLTSGDYHTTKVEIKPGDYVHVKVSLYSYYRKMLDIGDE